MTKSVFVIDDPDLTKKVEFHVQTKQSFSVLIRASFPNAPALLRTISVLIGEEEKRTIWQSFLDTAISGGTAGKLAIAIVSKQFRVSMNKSPIGAEIVFEPIN